MTSSTWIPSNSGTTVHSVLPDGRRVVRRDNPNAWFIENLVDGSCTQVSMDEAVAVAMEGTVKLGIAGGAKFDDRISRVLESRSLAGE